MSDDVLRTYTIYFNPRDFPGRYVVREFFVASATGFSPIPNPTPLAVVDTLEQARAALPPGLANINRYIEDEPQIVETWL